MPFMIAEVYPMKRMPRTFQYLDYLIPEGMTIKRGMMVEIPFRTQRIYGIVKQVKDRPFRGITLKSLLSLETRVHLRDQELTFFEQTAQHLIQSVSSLLYIHLPQPTKRSLHPSIKKISAIALSVPIQESTLIAQTVERMNDRRSAFVRVPDLRRTAALIARFLHQHPMQKCLILCPTVRDVRILSQVLSVHQPLCVTGEEKNEERFFVFQQWKEATRSVFITTRTGLFYADVSTTTIFVVRSSHPQHIQHDRNPRMDSREMVQTFSDMFMTRFYFFDVFPGVEEIVRFGKERILSLPVAPTICWVDAVKERMASSQGVLCASSIAAVSDALLHQQRVLLIYNKKEFSAVLADKLHTPFPSHRIQIVDAHHTQYDPACEITIATQYFFEQIFDPFGAAWYGCIVHVDPDTALFSGDFRATEQTLITLAQWVGMAYSHRALFVVQTEQIELLKDTWSDPMRFLEQEALMRQQYAQPPFSRWIRVTIVEGERRKHEMETHVLTSKLSALHGVRVREDETSVVVQSPPERMDDVERIFSTLDDHYIVDMFAFS